MGRKKAALRALMTIWTAAILLTLFASEAVQAAVVENRIKAVSGMSARAS